MLAVTLELSYEDVSLLRCALETDIDELRARMARWVGRSVRPDPHGAAGAALRCALALRQAELMYRRIMTDSDGFWGDEEYMPACYRTPPIPKEAAA